MSLDFYLMKKQSESNQVCGGECWMCGRESVESRVPPILASVSVPIPARGEVSGISYWNTVV